MVGKHILVGERGRGGLGSFVWGWGVWGDLKGFMLSKTVLHVPASRSPNGATGHQFSTLHNRDMLQGRPATTLARTGQRRRPAQLGRTHAP